MYLATGDAGHVRKTLNRMDWSARRPRLLVSFHERYHRSYVRDSARYAYRPESTMLDSGAFSAWNCGATIDIEALIAESKDPRWTESVALDVIGDAEASHRNAFYMKAKGSPAFPVFHIGDPWGHLDDYCAAFPKVGLSCRFGEPDRESYRWLERCFARAWPHKFHSFGWIAAAMLRRFPFHSADAASWSVEPGAYGRWGSFGKLSVRNMTKIHDTPLMAEIDHYLRLERELASRWSAEFAALGWT